MKKTTIYLLVFVMSMSFLPSTMFGASGNNVALSEKAPREIPANVKIQLDRLDEIKALDKSNLTSSEKKVLRKEVRTIKTSLVKSGNGIYLSVGAIIIIVLLLILLL